MFGYITAAPELLSEEARSRYGACYCGLCRRLQKRQGLFGRMTLSYDMTFLVLVLSSLYEPEEKTGTARCPVHPIHKRPYFYNKFTDYGADLNLMLAYYDCMDDWEDEKSLSRLLLAKILKGRFSRLAPKYPRQAKVMEESLRALHRYENGPEVSADRAAEVFGTLMGELFVPEEQDHWAPALRAMGQGLGRFIYIMDACIDYHRDEKHGRPNPLRSVTAGERSREEDMDLLTMLLSDATRAFEYLPLERDLDIMRNILYSGVWQQYNRAFRKRDGRADTVQEKEKE